VGEWAQVFRGWGGLVVVGIDGARGYTWRYIVGVHRSWGAYLRRKRYPSLINTCMLDVPSRYPPYCQPNVLLADVAVSVMRLQGEKKAR
jgi:hypothetical protein